MPKPSTKQVDLRTSMETLVKWVKAHAKKGKTIREHSDVYHDTASHFDLYDSKNLAPLWLSRVVDGVLRDLAEGTSSI